MTNSSPAPQSPTPSPKPAIAGSKQAEKTTPLRCLIGASISSGLGVILYFLTLSIVQTFAHTPLPNKSGFALNIAVAVRTLVVGVSTLATGLFGFATLGLIALAIQLWVQQSQRSSS